MSRGYEKTKKIAQQPRKKNNKEKRINRWVAYVMVYMWYREERWDIGNVVVS